MARCAAASSFSAAWSLSVAVSVAQQDRVVAAGAVDQDIGEPDAQRVAVGDVAAFHRPFQAMRIGIGAGWERRRKPGEQMKQRAGREAMLEEYWSEDWRMLEWQYSPSPCGRGLGGGGHACATAPPPNPLPQGEGE